MLQVSNDEFVKAVFGEDAPWSHVTDFPYPPDAIPAERNLIAWKGDYYSRYTFSENTNQYFTVSTFYPDEQGQARRRKELYRQTHCIMLDDIREKLSEEAAARLPAPSWKLETSKGSEQWGYILETPCVDGSQVENLIDGLIQSDLVPAHKDSGMKGTTRYGKLPESINNKASKLLDGQPFQSRMLYWHPENKTTMEALAAPFVIDLHRSRADSVTSGVNVELLDHPILQHPDLIKVKSYKGGKAEITCPWVEDHTGGADNGAAVFTRDDGSIGFKCHHSCENKNGPDVIRWMGEHVPTFSDDLKAYQFNMALSTLTPEISFLDAPHTITPDRVAPTPPASMMAQSGSLQLQISKLRSMDTTSHEARTLAAGLLKLVEQLPNIDQLHWHTEISDQMRWNKAETKMILKGLREEWYSGGNNARDFHRDHLFIRAINQFYSPRKRMFYTPEAFGNSYAKQDPDARRNALDGGCTIVDKLDYAPSQPPTFSEGGIEFANSWSNETQSTGEIGPVDRWLSHFDITGLHKEQKHIMQWMAFTLRYPSMKINHALMLGGGEGIGKDFLLFPLIKAMGANSRTIAGEELLSQFNEYALNVKHLHVNEVQFTGGSGDGIANKMKPLAAAPPMTLHINKKGVGIMETRNIVNVSLTSNSPTPFKLQGISRRYFAVWSDWNPRDELGNLKPEWKIYWKANWDWMLDAGWKAVAYYLIHQVDLSDFDPSASPEVTEFQREIAEASESPLETTIKDHVFKKYGVFRSDLLTRGDIGGALRNGAFNEHEMHVDPKMLTDKKVGIEMRKIGTFHQIKTPKANLWCVRNHDEYKDMTRDDVYDDYLRQIKGKGR